MKRYNMNDKGNDIVPLALIALELGIALDALVSRLGSAIVVDGIGIRCLPTDGARHVVAEHHAAVRAARDQADAELKAANGKPNPTRERIRALRAAQRHMETPVGEMLPGEALEVLKQMDGTRDEQLHASATRFDELVTGRLTYHRIDEKD
jgi:hypothetical protein